MTLKEALIKLLPYIQGIALLMSPFFVAMAVTSVMIFDAPNSTEQLFNWLMFGFIVSAPLVVIVSFILFLWLRKSPHTNFRLLTGLLPIPYILLIILFAFI